MKRGDCITIAGGSDHAGKPRPAIVVQIEEAGTLGSVVVVPMTSELGHAPLFRVQIDPDAANRLSESSDAMVDKMIALPERKVGRRFGTLAKRDLDRIDRVLLVLLGLAGS